MKVSASGLSFFFVAAQVLADQKPVEAAKIGIDYVLIGRSGIPVGQQFKAGGKLFLSGHPAEGLQFVASEINGRKLDTPVAMAIRNPGRLQKMSRTEDISVDCHEVGELKKIELVNQVDRSNVGKMGCTLELVIEKVIKRGGPLVSSSTDH